MLEQKIPVTVVLNDSPNTLAMDFPGKFDYREYKLFKEEKTNLSVQATGTFNKSLVKMCYDIDECDHSNIEVKVMP